MPVATIEATTLTTTTTMAPMIDMSVVSILVVADQAWPWYRIAIVIIVHRMPFSIWPRPIKAAAVVEEEEEEEREASPIVGPLSPCTAPVSPSTMDHTVVWTIQPIRNF
jgi:hypothetical protein